MMESQAQYCELPSWRKDFKQAWKKASKIPITLSLNIKYRLDLCTWVCTCPDFHKSQFLICKHLVQSCHLVLPVFFLQVHCNQTMLFWKHKKLVPLVMHDNDTVSTDEQQVAEDRSEMNESDFDQSDGEELEGNVIDTEGPNVVGGLTFSKCIEAWVALLWDSDGLEYQLHFGDSCMLDCLEQESTGFFRMVESCLSCEHCLNLTRGASLMTWEKATSSALFYRT